MKHRGSARSSRSARYDESKTTRGRHRLRQPQPPRVERDSPVKPEVSGRKSFRPAIHLSRIQINSIFRKRILCPPYLDRALPLRRHVSSSSVPPSSGSTPAPIAVDSLSPKSGSPPPSSRSATPVKLPVLKMDLFGEASIDPDGSIRMNSDARDADNTLLPPAEYNRLAKTRVFRAEWLPGYRDRVPWSYNHVHPRSICRVSLDCVAELDPYTMFKHVTRPKGYIFPDPTAFRSNATPSESN